MSQPLQKALLLQTKQGSFAVSTIPRPLSATPGELLVKVMASGLNPGDWKVKEYGWFLADDHYPAILGADVAGEVEEVGNGVMGFKKGDRVFFNGRSGKQSEYAGYQQYARAPADITVKIPARLSYAQAATMSAGLNTAAIGLYAKEPIGLALNPDFDPDIKFSGKAALVIGGSCCVGQYAIQLLRYLDFSPIIVYASKHNFDYLRNLGATELIDRNEVSPESLATAAKSRTLNAIDVVFDAVGSDETQQAGYDALLNGGKMVVTMFLSQIKGKSDGDGKKVLGVIGNVQREENREFGRTIARKLSNLVKEGIIVPNRYDVLPDGLNGITEGLGRIKNNKVSGVKLVVYPQETA
ncbi:hypothetical protein D9758_005050 [Tetrapyrgos nigripes]|uniref:Enoyl reductase (ER) domain-containing protein n=1 Tax=Tetrapyrgos nigripes TaxID=182062 RepID=A0A8H5GWL0_9AGAR|nr:hypothetical protein D9758_005050 [Tetrapyrgos nigripes]